MLRAVEATARLKKVARSTLAEDVYDQLRASIVSSVFRPGERLVEARLAEELGVSRGTVRDALRRLAADGLIEEQPHRGSVVKELTLDELVDIFNVRVGL